MYLYQSNRLENLFAALCKTLAEPISNPLAPEVIVVQNPGMARWLSQQIALRTGISAHLSFPLPASFVWNIFEQTLGDLPDLSQFDRNVLLWRIQRELETLLTDPSMQEINAYLQDGHDGNKKFQLAEKITDLFDQYLVYRPEMLLEWEKGEAAEGKGTIKGGENLWQAKLWQQLTNKHKNHRAALLRQFIQIARAGKLRTDMLPERVCIFGINSLAPAYLEVIDQISRHIDIHIFHLSPCRQAWDDILPERLLAIKRQSWRNQGTDDISDYFTSGNPLLASMGTVGQEFFSQLMWMNPMEADFYEKPEPTRLLNMIQADILDLRDRGGQDNRGDQDEYENRSRQQSTPLIFADNFDNSIRFHCCHSPMREIQVLHDRLLDLFTADPELKPADILVMAPDINLYAPATAGVFGSAPPARRIPWSIADQSRRQEEPIIEGFLELLALIDSRFTAPDVVALLENQAILQRFALAEEDITIMRSRIMDAGIRWGLDQEQRREQGVNSSEQHTWDFGLDRLLLGYITGPLKEPWQGIMPCSGTVNDTGPWLGGLTDFIRHLQQLRREMSRNHSPADWAVLLLRLINDFLSCEGVDGADAMRDGLLILRQTIADFVANCRKAEFDQDINLAIIRHFFERQLAEPAGGQAFLAGRVTFCNMVPMRSVPFKVIWLLGMNDMDYPRSQRPPAFDLMAKHPRLGDRSRRDDDRYLFLEALLSARNHLSISWVGRDQQDNSSLPPSVVVAELRDYINRGWLAGSEPSGALGDEPSNKQPTAEMLTVEYPLQPFSRHCFDGDPATATYATEWLPKAISHVDQSSAFSSQALPALNLPQQQVDIGQLVRFWNHPVRFFLEQRIGLRTRLEGDLLPENEAFSLDHLQKYLLVQEIVTNLRSDKTSKERPATLFYRLQAAGGLPGGKFGRILYQEMEESAAALVEELEPLTRQPEESVELINLTVDTMQITGRLSSLYGSGRITLRPATLKANDILQLWIHHLVLLLIRPAAVRSVSIHAAIDKTVSFHEVDDPQAEFAALLHFFQQGLSEPLHFYPKTSHAWAKAKSETAAWNAARRTWYSGYYTGEEEDPAYEIGLRGHEPLDQRFVELAGLFHPVLDSMGNGIG